MAQQTDHEVAGGRGHLRDPPAGVAGGRGRSEEVLELPGQRLRARVVPVGLDHYALPGDSMAEAARARSLRRGFQGYTTDSAPVLIGFGASAIRR